MAKNAIAPRSIADGEKDIAAFAQGLGSDFARYGFAVVADHGIAPAVIDEAFDRTRRFFALPEDVKRKYLVAGGGGQRGYTPFGI
ncbi:MAG: 2-oxoglutarate and iron-dependent oxygenase domain-containing protein, partial [Rhodospirillaceae bacterium]|nr:2-oxoglutarate and iron-dependent oxygenase domain-containing protein [Rhodospirillaceae bacterium]